jgi:hypothetical protein
VRQLNGNVARVLEVQQGRRKVARLVAVARNRRATTETVLGADGVDAVPGKGLGARGGRDVVLADRVGVVPVDWGESSVSSCGGGFFLLTLETARVRDGRVGAVAGQADLGELKVEKVELSHGQPLEEDHALVVLRGAGNEGEARGREEERRSPHGDG